MPTEPMDSDTFKTTIPAHLIRPVAELQRKPIIIGEKKYFQTNRNFVQFRWPVRVANPNNAKRWATLLPGK